MATPLTDPELTDLIVQASDAFTPSQAELASEVGVQPLALTTWRRGRSRPTREHLRNMAHALEKRAERLAVLAERLQERAAAHEPLTRRRTNPARSSDLALARQFARRITEAAPVLRIVFYGSRARGNPASAKSDYDFVVVLHETPPDVESIERQLNDAAAGGLGGQRPTLDIWVCGIDEWNRTRALPGHPLRTADTEGVVLYERV